MTREEFNHALQGLNKELLETLGLSKKQALHSAMSKYEVMWSPAGPYLKGASKEVEWFAIIIRPEGQAVKIEGMNEAAAVGLLNNIKNMPRTVCIIGPKWRPVDDDR